MDDLHPMAEQALRDQGFTDAEIDELRRTGTITRADDSGASVSLSSTELNAAQIPPETIEMLRRFKRFIPKQTMHQVETAIGEDIDGDGHIGANSVVAIPTRASGRSAVDASSPITSGAMPTATPDGPFVQRQRGASLLPAILVLLAVAAAVYYFVLR